MNPGLVSHMAKKGLLEAASYFLENKQQFEDLNFEEIKEYLAAKNFPKLAQACGLHTIHSSERDSQKLLPPPKDSKTKLYTT